MDQFLYGKAPLISVQGSQSKVIIFHCEFSSERGPKMLRFLRQQDRSMNKDSYPALHFPEVYILEGGYKAFWEHYNEKNQTTLCQPEGYKLMLDEDHSEDLKFFRKKSKSFTGGDCGAQGVRSRRRKLQSRLF